ncbi:hypothetical protein [Streptomyces sp. 8N706]|uniref:hypothetical protein n=1 Tax=Streptomyces sp. 8N706 TaxID=3457416 RepID=UPI003FD34472
MSQMQRGLIHAAAWSLATGAAVTLSWWGVHTVLAGTAYDPPRALPLQGDTTVRSGEAEAQSSSTHRPKSPSPSAPTSRKPSSTPAKPTPRPTRKSPAPAAGNVKSYPVEGGRVVFDLGRSSASLVSATPEAGWRMQVWKQPEWIRVDFTAGAETTSVFCTWNGHPPTVQTSR